MSTTSRYFVDKSTMRTLKQGSNKRWELAPIDHHSVGRTPPSGAVYYSGERILPQIQEDIALRGWRFLFRLVTYPISLVSTLRHVSYPWIVMRIKDATGGYVNASLTGRTVPISSLPVSGAACRSI